jgi:hypothetical protein
MRDDHDEDEDDAFTAASVRKQPRERRPARPDRAGDGGRSGGRGPSRAVRQGQESFKCVNCRAFIGPTVSGGRHRNHCPLCLYSRHVDGRRPGDRASDCGAKMAPVGRFTRADGEPMILHRCLGCGFARANRLAADDNMLAFEELPVISASEAEPEMVHADDR